MPTLKLTEAKIKAAKPKSTRYDLHDTAQKGLLVRVYPSGQKTFMVHYRTRAGVQRRPRIEAVGAISLKAAQRTARDWLARVALGEDPSQDDKDAREAPTVSKACDDWLKSTKNVKKEKSRREDKRIVKTYIKKQIGAVKVEALTKAQVEKLHKSIGEDAPYMANRVRACLSTIMTYCEEQEWRPQGSNPCRRVRPFPEERKHNVLDELAIRRLGKALDEWPHLPHEMILVDGKRKKHTRTLEKIERSPEDVTRRLQVCDAIRLIFATGCRRSEILGLTWDEVDLDRGVLMLKDSKSGARQVVLTRAAKAILKRQKRTPLSPFVFTSQTTTDDGKAKASLYDMKRGWADLRKLARITGFRLHDARHQLGQTLTDLGYSELIIGACLGHKGKSITSVYIGAGTEIVREALERYGESIKPIVGVVPDIKSDEIDQTADGGES